MNGYNTKGQFLLHVEKKTSICNPSKLVPLVVRQTKHIVNPSQARSDELQKKILDLDAEQAARIGRYTRPNTQPNANPLIPSLPPLGRNDSPSTRIDAELDSHLRENIKLSEEMLTMIKSERGNDICEQLSILSALRSADTDSTASRATNTGKSRDRQNKRKLTDAIDDRDSIAADSPVAPSPKISGKERLLQKSGGSRAGSVPMGRESSVKVEEDSEHVKGKEKRSSTISSSAVPSGKSGSR